MEGLCNTRFDAARLLAPYQRLALARTFSLAQRLWSGCADATFPTLLADRIVQAFCALLEPKLQMSTTRGQTTMRTDISGGKGAADGDDRSGDATPAAKRPRRSSEQQEYTRSSYRLLPAEVSAVRRRFERELFPVYLIKNGWRYVVPYTDRRCA